MVVNMVKGWSFGFFLLVSSCGGTPESDTTLKHSLRMRNARRAALQCVTRLPALNDAEFAEDNPKSAANDLQVECEVERQAA